MTFTSSWRCLTTSSSTWWATLYSKLTKMTCSAVSTFRPWKQCANLTRRSVSISCASLWTSTFKRCVVCFLNSSWKIALKVKLTSKRESLSWVQPNSKLVKSIVPLLSGVTRLLTSTPAFAKTWRKWAKLTTAAWTAVASVTMALTFDW